MCIQNASDAFPRSRFERYLQGEFQLALNRLTTAETKVATALRASRYEEYLHDKFTTAMNRLSRMEKAAGEALTVATFNHWLQRFQSQSDPWTPVPEGDQTESAASPPGMPFHPPHGRMEN